MFLSVLLSFFFFFNDTATTEIYTLSLHDALPISAAHPQWYDVNRCFIDERPDVIHGPGHADIRTRGRTAQSRRWITADNRHSDFRNLLTDQRQDLVEEEQHRVFVRVPIHCADEDKTRGRFRDSIRSEVRGVDAG